MIPCPVCSAAATTFKDIQLGCTTHRCAQCGLIFKDPSCYPSEAQELKKYREHNNSLENAGYVAMFEQFLDFVLAQVSHHMQTALDYGSGPAPVLAQLLKRRGFETAIYDKFFAPDPLDESARFDLVTSTEVIEHVADPIAFLTQLKAHTKPGGTIALMTQFHDGSEAFYQTWWYRRDPTHLCFFTPRTLQTLAASLGLGYIADDGKKIAVLRTPS